MSEDEKRVELEEEEEEDTWEEPRPGGWTPGVDAGVGGSVFVDTGRGGAAEVQAGALFKEALEHIAEEAHYGGYFRVFLNGDELINPEDAPETIEPGMRIAITSYDKVG